MPEFPAVLLGAGGLSPLEVAGMYLTMAAGGFNTPLRSTTEIVDSHGVPLSRYPLTITSQFDSGSIHLLEYMLIEVMREGTGRGAYRHLDSSFAVAGKTGTTDDSRDSWFVGYSGDLLAVVWIGRDDNGKTSLTGSSAALPVWARFMASASRRPLKPLLPEGVEYHWIETSTGRRTGEGCQDARYVPFKAGTEPSRHTGCRRSGRSFKSWLEKLFNR